MCVFVCCSVRSFVVTREIPIFKWLSTSICVRVDFKLFYCCAGSHFFYSQSLSHTFILILLTVQGWYLYLVTQRWFGMRIDIVSAFYLGVVAVISVPLARSECLTTRMYTFSFCMFAINFPYQVLQL